MKHTMYEIADGLCEVAVQMWHNDGAIMTTSFAMGHSRSLFARPIDDRGTLIDRDTRVQIQALIGASVGAVFIGRIDESYLKYQDIDAPIPKIGDLEKMADTDPTIRTSLVVHIVDVATNKSYASMAVLDIDDDGEPEFIYESFDDPEGDYVIDSSRSMLLMEFMTDPITDTQLRDELYEIGWGLIDSDEAPTDKGDDQ